LPLPVVSIEPLLLPPVVTGGVLVVSFCFEQAAVKIKTAIANKNLVIKFNC
jgi:ABC-type molybdate transport system permease subunit